MDFSTGALFNGAPTTDGVPPEVFGLLYAIMRCSSVEAVKAPMQDLVVLLGYGGFGFGLIWREDRSLYGEIALSGGVMDTILPAYAAANLAAHDPLLAELMSARGPVFWADFLNGALRSASSSHDTELRQLFASAGVEAGASVPVDIPALGCRAGMALAAAPGMTPPTFDETFARNGWFVRLTAVALGLVCGDRMAIRVGGALSRSEVAVLEALANGHRPREIASRFGKSEHTIRNQIVSAQNRLGVRTKEQAVAKALRFGLIAP